MVYPKTPPPRYPGDRRSVNSLPVLPEGMEEHIRERMKFMGFDPEEYRKDVDICEDGSVWVNLTQVCPKGTVF